MANIKSSAKRAQLQKVQYMRNKAAKTALKTTIKKFDAAVSGEDRETAVGAYKVAVKSVDKAVAKGLIHKNNAAHKKSKMAVKLNTMAQ
ncbi:30S ribosomal protein S20 [Clostridiaceae bacterium OttesenSCG-928-D20]|nr:30S ribosomal protein S20 [Clostridiaceae bacterium OttesenSCG-928-D20]